MDEKLEAGKQSLQQIEVSTVTKTTAKADVANAINNKREQININRQATTEEKDEALNQLKQEETKAIMQLIQPQQIKMLMMPKHNTWQVLKIFSLILLKACIK